MAQPAVACQYLYPDSADCSKERLFPSLVRYRISHLSLGNTRLVRTGLARQANHRRDLLFWPKPLGDARWLVPRFNRKVFRNLESH